MSTETKEQAVQVQEEVLEVPEETAQTTEITPEVEVPEKEEAKAEVAEKKLQKKKEAEEIVEERFYTIPLQKALIRPPKKRAPRAMQLIKIFVTKHMKLDIKVSEEDEEEELPQLIVSQEVNEKVWGRGIEKPPRKIKTRVTKDKDGNVFVYLAEN